MAIRRKEDKLVWYSCVVSMSKTLRNRGFQYQYVVWKKDKEKPIRETVYRGTPNSSGKRYFVIPNEKKSQNTLWEQYDGFVYPKLSETAFERIFKAVHIYDSLKQKLSYDISVATKFFLPTQAKVASTLRQDVTDDYAAAWSLVERINNVINQMAHKQKHSEFKKEILTDYVVPMLVYLENLEQKPERESLKHTDGFLLAVFILVLFRTNNMEHLCISFNKHLFRNLHLYPDRKNLKCSALEALEIHFPSMKEKIADMLLEMIQSYSKFCCSDNSVDSTWLYLMPHLHFLRGDSSPFVKPFAEEHTSSKWWGHTHLTPLVNDMKCYRWTITPAEIVQDLEYLFDVDYLLPRTIMACISFRHLKLATSLQKIPAAVCCATLYYYCGFLFDMLHNDRMYLAECFTDVSKKFKMEREERQDQHHCSSSTFEECFKTRKQGMKIAADVLMTCQRSSFVLIELIYAATELFASSVYECPIHEEELINSDQRTLRKQINEEMQTSMEQCMKSVNKWMEREFTFGKQHCNILQSWNLMMDVDFGIESLSEKWRTLTLEAVQAALSQITPEDCLKLFENCDIIELNKDLQSAMSKVAFKSFEKYMHEGKEVVLQRVSNFANFMSSMVEINLARDESEIIEHVLTWRPLVPYFKHLEKLGDKLKKLLSPIATNLIERARNIIDTVRKMITKGDNPVRQLEVILKNRNHYLDLVKYALGFDETQIGVMQCVLQARDMELKAYKRDLSYASKLLRMATHMPKKVDSSHLMDDIHHMEKTLEEELHINICKPLPLEKANEENLKSYKPSTRIAGLSKETLEYAPTLERLGKSKIFMEMWRKEALKIHEDTVFEVAFTAVYQKTTKTWRTFCRNVTEGTVSFGSMYERLKVCEKDFHHIEKEFLLINGDSNKDWVPERIDQLRQYDLLQSCQKAAQILFEVKTIYELTGDFSAIEAIEKLGNNENQPMKDLDMSVANTCRILESWKDDKKQECINAYKESRRLVKWLMDSMSDMKEVKVFVDLAFISAGEEPAEIQKVSCFHSAVTGYAPLIFHTPPDCDCMQFLGNCNQVFQALQSDPYLHLNLRTASQHLHWLKDVKESHGSVEVTSLTQADNINMRGCYKIGNLQNIDVSELSLDHVISLHVTQDDSRDEDSAPKEYSHSKLVELQSKLMLVAGKAQRGRENVDHFVMVLDGVDRLAKTYIRLCSNGCVLFNSWNGEFLCGNDTNVCAVLNFGSDQNLETLKGHRGAEGVDKFILSLANQFDEFHEDWLKYVSDKRDEYLELNHYTIDQLVFLQKELIKLGSEDEPSLLVYPMLSLIKPDCTIADLTKAMQNAKDIVFATEEEKEVNRKSEDIQETDNDLVETFMKTMLDSDFSIRLAKKALNAVGAENVDEGVVWCLERQDEDEEEDEEDCEPAETFDGWQVEKGSVSSSAAAWIRTLTDEKSDTVTVDQLLKNLKSVWTKFLEAVSSSVADYLSLQHLGIILRELTKAVDCIFARTIPAPLKPGIPNLIVCPQVDLLNAVIYLYKHTDNQPLPKPDEVLLCTPQTTFDQVDIFLRRAFFSNPGKAYTLANADLLLYEIEERTEKKLKEYATRLEGYADYQLVVLCSTENEFKARIVAALERNRCPPPPLQNLQDIRQYLKMKFSQTCEVKGIQSASSLDFENSNVRVIKSKRAGVGKSLYKKRLAENIQNQDRGLQIQNPELPSSVTIHLYNKTVSTASVAERLLNHTLEQGIIMPRIFHLDISYEVQEGVDYLLFNLLILGCISNKVGHVWLKSPLDLYLIETIPIQESGQFMRAGQLIHPLLEVLPDVHCWSPQDSLQILTTDVKPEEYSDHDSLFDDKEFRSEVYQRPFQYLKRCSNKAGLARINPAVPEGSHQECLQVLLQHCGVRDPAWSELHNFVWFLNTQLVDFEKSVFCSDVILEDLPGFPALVLQFLIQMSRDFATRSLVMSEQSPLDQLNAQESEEDLAQFQMKRTWESSPHPYIFFNPDGHTMTFLGFNIERHSGDMVDQQTGQVLERGLVPRRLQDGLKRNRVNINENFEQMSRLERLEKLCNVMPGVDFVHDPDDTYELTTDNVKKILAIYMRFRCGIPVIIMGETGCGKTRLVKFMCALQCPPGSEIENMVIMKVHGGTTSEDIIKKVKSAEKLAAANKARNPHMYTVLFFDEANTTESIGLIKEIMCDGAIEGQPLKLDENLKIVAACNPYRKYAVALHS